MSGESQDTKIPGQPEDQKVADIRASYRNFLGSNDETMDPQGLSARIEALSPESRRKLAYDLFRREFDFEVPPMVTMKPRDIVSDQAESRQTIEKVISGITEGDLQSFQEYGFRLIREGSSLVPRPASISQFGTDYWRGGRSIDQDDLVNLQPDDLRFSSGAPQIMRGIARAFPGIPYNWDRGVTPFGQLYCVVGEKNGKIIFQGAGETHRDSVMRFNTSSFRLQFSDPDSVQAFIQTMKEKPSEVLGAIFSDGTKTAMERNRFSNSELPFNYVTKVGIMDLRTGQSSISDIPQAPQVPQT